MEKGEKAGGHHLAYRGARGRGDGALEVCLVGKDCFISSKLLLSSSLDPEYMSAVLVHVHILLAKLPPRLGRVEINIPVPKLPTIFITPKINPLLLRIVK